ncbi:FmdE family protein [Simplicispira lacusdiani]|uniref:FmdE family protein n=1 Tax=Simplicispira lacusdiani TaxID=2213010 RepID=UPI001E3DF3ED|nr:FmdE family protein [Simplicispira lacusdiani]
MTQDTQSRGFPAFFDAAPRLTVRDPLAHFLGAATEGEMDYTFADAVRLAGHSCPTVAGAYLMALHGLRALYGGEPPERGGIDVLVRDARDSGVTGVIASVLQLLTGAAPETGFQGIGPAHRFARKNLMVFGVAMDGLFALRRQDTGQAVQVDWNSALVPWAEDIKTLMPQAVSGRADEAALARFGQLWQDRVRRILIDHADDPRLVQVSDWTPAA